MPCLSYVYSRGARPGRRRGLQGEVLGLGGARAASRAVLSPPRSGCWGQQGERGEGNGAGGSPCQNFSALPKKKQSRQQPRTSGISGQASRQQSSQRRSENSLQGTQTRASAEAAFCRWSLLSLQYLGRRDMMAGTLPSWFLSVGSPAPQGTGSQTVSPRLPTASQRPRWLLAAGLGFGVCSETATSGSLTCCEDF